MTTFSLLPSIAGGFFGLTIYWTWVLTKLLSIPLERPTIDTYKKTMKIRVGVQQYELRVMTFAIVSMVGFIVSSIWWMFS